MTIDRIYKALSVYEVSFDTYILTNYQLFHISLGFSDLKSQKITLANSIRKDYTKRLCRALRTDKKAGDLAQEKK